MTTTTTTTLAAAAADEIASAFHNLPAGSVPTVEENETTAGGYPAEAWITNYITVYPHEIDHEHAHRLPPFVAAVTWNVKPYASAAVQARPAVALAAFITPTGGRLPRTMSPAAAAEIELAAAELLAGFGPRYR
jgi:hypothetical protein